MPRLTRSEMQQQTRERLLAAAESEIARLGIEAASIRAIADAAGFSLGAVYSNFENKEAMLRELMERQMRKEVEDFREIASGKNQRNPETILADLGAWLKSMQDNEVLSALVVEFHLYASRNPAFKEQFHQSKSVRMEQIAEGLKTLFESSGLQLDMDPMQVAQGLSALWVGFAIQGSGGGGQSAAEVTLYFIKALLNSAVPTSKTLNK